MQEHKIMRERKKKTSPGFVQTCSVSRRHQCHSWSTRCWAAGLRSWHSSAFSAFHTPGRGAPGPSAWTWHPACTSWQIPHKSVSPVPRQNPSHPAQGRTQWRGSGREREEAGGCDKKDKDGVRLIISQSTKKNEKSRTRERVVRTLSFPLLKAHTDVWYPEWPRSTNTTFLAFSSGAGRSCL